MTVGKWETSGGVDPGLLSCLSFGVHSIHQCAEGRSAALGFWGSDQTVQDWISTMAPPSQDSVPVRAARNVPVIVTYFWLILCSSRSMSLLGLIRTALASIMCLASSSCINRKGC